MTSDNKMDSKQCFRLEFVGVGCSPRHLTSVSTVSMKDIGTLFLNWDFRKTGLSESGKSADFLGVYY